MYSKEEMFWMYTFEDRIKDEMKVAAEERAYGMGRGITMDYLSDNGIPVKSFDDCCKRN